MIGWLTSKVGVIALAGVLIVVSGAALRDGIVNRTTIRLLEGDKTALSQILAGAQKNLGTCHANVTTLDGSLKVISADVVKLGDATKAAGDRATAAAQAAAAQSKAARASADAVLGLPRPAPDMACEAAARLLRGGL